MAKTSQLRLALDDPPPTPPFPMAETAEILNRMADLLIQLATTARPNPAQEGNDEPPR
jgi:hypothetical protein